MDFQNINKNLPQYQLKWKLIELFFFFTLVCFLLFLLLIQKLITAPPQSFTACWVKTASSSLAYTTLLNEKSFFSRFLILQSNSVTQKIIEMIAAIKKKKK